MVISVFVAATFATIVSPAINETNFNIDAAALARHALGTDDRAATREPRHFARDVDAGGMVRSHRDRDRHPLGVLSGYFRDSSTTL